MKKYLLVVLLAMAVVNGWAQSSPFAIHADGYQQLCLGFTAGELTAQPFVADGQTFAVLQMDGALFSQKEGLPNLPTYSTLIEVPLCQSFSIEVNQAQYDTLSLAALGVDAPVLPLQPSRSKSDTAYHPLVWDKSAYSTDAFQGADFALVERVGIARDRNLARLQVSPIRYNAVKGQVIICRQAQITISYVGADRAATQQLFQRYHSPAFAVPGILNSLYPKSVRTAAPVRYLIVAHSMFRGQLDGFVTWKQRKGFLTDIVYTDDPAVGTTTTAISSYIHSQYTNATAANPAPTYVLLVGDHEQIPAYTGVSSTAHITDLYYMTWTSGDNFPDCYYGRFSAQSVADLTPQVDKTLMYEQYTFADPSFLDCAVMVAGVDGGSANDYGYTHADPAMDYAITNYVNGAHGFSNIYYFKNNTSIVPTATNVTMGSNASSNSATVRNYYNLGAGWINYSAHGSATSWGTPNFTTTHAAAMTNTQKFGLMIGNCCLTNKFETQTCLGEAVLRKGNYCGAVGYIGGTNSTYWYEDFYWAVGLRASSSVGPSISMAFDASNPGNYDAFCHTHGEAHSQWVETQGALVVNGNTIVEGSTSSRKLYYWEIYQLMGDPALMPYLTQADTIPLTAPSFVACGTPSITVQAVPYAYVALTDTLTHTLVVSAYADSTGLALLPLPTSLGVGGYEIAASAQQYRTAFHPLGMIVPDGAFVVAQAPSAQVAAGSQQWLSGSLVNVGSSDAQHVTVRFSCDHPQVTLLNDSIQILNLPAGDTLTLDSLVHIATTAQLSDMESFAIAAVCSWDSAAADVSTSNRMVAIAPKPIVRYVNLPQAMLPGDSLMLDLSVTNMGHLDMPAATLHLTSPVYPVRITAVDTSALLLPVGDSAIRQFALVVDSVVPYNIVVPLQAVWGQPVAAVGTDASFMVGLPVVETFEGLVYHLSGWTQGTYPWAITSDESQSGSYSARSNATLTHSQTSEITITRTISVDDSISFYYKVSSEANYDKFHFYIDNEEQFNASGLVDWTRAAYPVTAGAHSFKFTYQKDVSVNRNSDCAWIDQVQLPSLSRPWTASADTLCYGEPLVVMGQVVNTQVSGVLDMVDTTADTVVFLHYVVLPQLMSDTTITVCDQYRWRDTLFTLSTTFADTLVSAQGCPEYRLTHLVVHHSSDTLLAKQACDSLIWNNRVYTSSATYADTLTNTVGCDSVVTLQLTVYPSYTDTVTLVVEESPYVWNDTSYSHSGVYMQLFKSEYGCDSLVVLHLTISGTQGIGTADGAALRCYPNPTSGTLHFDAPVSHAVVYDYLGREAMRLRDTDRADLRPLPNGIYTIVVTLDDSTTTRFRIVLNR